jgi:hypothetical protein
MTVYANTQLAVRCVHRKSKKEKKNFINYRKLDEPTVRGVTAISRIEKHAVCVCAGGSVFFLQMVIGRSTIGKK